jgi:hypothetical protein
MTAYKNPLFTGCYLNNAVLLFKNDSHPAVDYRFYGVTARQKTGGMDAGIP